MKTTLTILLNFILSLIAFSTTPDSVLKFQDLKFNSEIEMNAFKSISTGSSFTTLDLFINNYTGDNIPYENIRKKIDEAVTAIESKIQDKSEQKKVKLIYEYVHDTFFKVYSYENSFTDVFKDGSYNCVSATALYALLFERLKIPYNIHETPVHVYLEVYPASSKILLETTTPKDGIFSLSDEFKRKYVQSLYSSKQISKADFENSKTETLFNKHYFASESISLKQLAGLQYSNYALYHIDRKKYSDAVSNSLKAEYLYDCQRHQFFLRHSLLMLLANTEYSNLDQVRLFSILCRFNKSYDEDVSIEVIQQESNRILNQFLINESNIAKTDSAYKIITASMSDTVLLNNIGFNYHYEMSRFMINDTRDTAIVWSHLREAYRIMPGNADLHKLVLLYFVRSIQKSDDLVNILKYMDELSLNYSFLKNSDPFLSTYAQCYLELTYRSFVLQNSIAGDDYINRFEKINSENKLSAVEIRDIEKAYSTAAGYYFKKGNIKKSKSMVQKGLNYVPGSFQLNQMMRQF